MAVATTVPVFKLYGETTAWPTPDLLHCESISTRSQLHQWEISPHQHSDLLQIIYIQAGTAELLVEDCLQRVAAPVLQVVPALCVHGFRFSRDVRGHVLTLARPLLERLSAQLQGAGVLHAQCFTPAVRQRERLDALFAAISEEYALPAMGRELMLQSLTGELLVQIGRWQLLQRDTEGPASDRGREHVRAFVNLLEVHFRAHWSIERYAERLGISSAHLNALCRRLCGDSALQMINQRLLLEAKRCLVYTSMTVSQVSDSLGFSDPAYFSRFFKRCGGLSPKAFRQQRG